MSIATQSQARTGYAICSVMRSGSSWLAELLTSTGVLGRPSEYFSTQLQQEWLAGPGYPTERRAQLDLVFNAGTTPNGIYGFKMYPAYFNEVAQDIGWSSAFPALRYIHLRRRDSVGQAISRVRAQQTRQWRSTFASSESARYDGPAIFEALQATLLQDARWDLYFALNGIAPLRLVYEEMTEAAQATVEAVARLVGIDPPVVKAGAVAIEVQRDALSLEWRERFLATYGNPDWMDEL